MVAPRATAAQRAEQATPEGQDENLSSVQTVEAHVAQTFRDQCGHLEAPPGQVVLYGSVVDHATATPLPGSEVKLRWKEPGTEAERVVVATADAAGRFLFCHVPAATPLSAAAHALGETGPRQEIILDPATLFTYAELSVFLTRLDGAIAGRLIDAETGQGIEAATLTVEETKASALTDAQGNFRMEALPPGSLELEIHHVAFGDQVATVEVVPGNTSQVSIRLHPEAIAMEPIEISIAMRPQWLENVGFYHRKERGLGQFLAPTDVERRKSRRFVELLRGIPGLGLSKICKPHCYYYMSTTTNPRLTYCPPIVFVDGQRFRLQALADLDAIASPHDVAAIEFYRGISQMPPQFYGECGSIVVWTKRGTSGG